MLKKQLNYCNKKIVLVAFILFLSFFIFQSITFAETNQIENDITIVLKINSPYMMVNGETAEIDSSPVIIGNRSLIPARSLITALGGSVNWYAPDKKIEITLNDKKIVMWLGSKNALVNNNNVIMDLPPTVVNSRTMIPIRFVVENLKLNIEWDSNTKTITIKQTEAINLSEYINDFHKIKMVYPTSWLKTEGIGANSENGTIIGLVSGNKLHSIDFSIEKLTNTLTNSEYSEIQKLNLKSKYTNFNLISEKKSTMFGFEAYEISYTYTANSTTYKCLDRWTVIDDYVYYINYTSTTEDYSKYKNLALIIFDSLYVTPYDTTTDTSTDTIEDTQDNTNTADTGTDTTDNNIDIIADTDNNQDSTSDNDLTNYSDDNLDNSVDGTSNNEYSDSSDEISDNSTLNTVDDIYSYLKSKYFEANTSFGLCPLSYSIEENKYSTKAYDFSIAVVMDNTFYFDVFYSKYSSDEIRTKVGTELRNFMETLAKDINSKMNGAKFTAEYQGSVTGVFYRCFNYEPATIYTSYEKTKVSDKISFDANLDRFKK